MVDIASLAALLALAIGKSIQRAHDSPCHSVSINRFCLSTTLDGDEWNAIAVDSATSFNRCIVS